MGPAPAILFSSRSARLPSKFRRPRSGSDKPLRLAQRIDDHGDAGDQHWGRQNLAHADPADDEAEIGIRLTEQLAERARDAAEPRDVGPGSPAGRTGSGPRFPLRKAGWGGAARARRTGKPSPRAH